MQTRSGPVSHTRSVQKDNCQTAQQPSFIHSSHLLVLPPSLRNRHYDSPDHHRHDASRAQRAGSTLARTRGRSGSWPWFRGRKEPREQELLPRQERGPQSCRLGGTRRYVTGVVFRPLRDFTQITPTDSCSDKAKAKTLLASIREALSTQR